VLASCKFGAHFSSLSALLSLPPHHKCNVTIHTACLDDLALIHSFSAIVVGSIPPKIYPTLKHHSLPLVQDLN